MLCGYSLRPIADRFARENNPRAADVPFDMELCYYCSTGTWAELDRGDRVVDGAAVGACCYTVD